MSSVDIKSNSDTLDKQGFRLHFTSPKGEEFDLEPSRAVDTLIKGGQIPPVDSEGWECKVVNINSNSEEVCSLTPQELFRLQWEHSKEVRELTTTLRDTDEKLGFFRCGTGLGWGSVGLLCGVLYLQNKWSDQRHADASKDGFSQGSSQMTCANTATDGGIAPTVWERGGTSSSDIPATVAVNWTPSADTEVVEKQ